MICIKIGTEITGELSIIGALEFSHLMEWVSLVGSLGVGVPGGFSSCLLIAKIISPLRERPKGTYITTMILCIGLPHLVTFLTDLYWVFLYMDILATLVCIFVLVWLMKRAQKSWDLNYINNL